MSTVFTMVLPAYTTADPVTSNTATVVEQEFKRNKIEIISSNLFIDFFFFGNLSLFLLFLFLFQSLSGLFALHLFLGSV